MYDDKEEGEETRAVLPSSHSWRAPTPIHRLSLSPFIRFYPHRAERASACVRACVYEGARVLARASCLRAFVWGEGGGDKGAVRARVYAWGVAFLYACTYVRVRARAWNRYMLSSVSFFFSLLILAVLPVSLRGSVFLLVEKATREGAL